MAIAYKNLSESLIAARRYEEWLANFREFERRCPDTLPLAVYALQAGQFLGDFALVDRYLDGLRKEAFVAANDAELVDCLEELLYLLLFFDFEPVDLLSLYRTYDAAAQHVYGKPMPLRVRPATAPIRVGYLSGDLRDHVMGKMMLPVLEQHDRDRYQTYCYSLSDSEDDVTARFRSVASSYVSLAGLSEA